MVITICNVNHAVRADGDACGQAKFARAGAALAQTQEKSARKVENLDVIVERIGYIYVVKRIRGHPFRPAEMARGITGTANFRNELPVTVEYLDAVVH